MANIGLISASNPVQIGQAAPTTVAAPITYQSEPATPAVNANAATAMQDQDKGTVAGQVRGLIAANDPLQQLAITQAKQQMNERGGLNSSMAIGAAVDAQNRAALPIAAADADAANRFALTNAANQQQVNLGNADTANKINILATEAKNTSNQFGAQQANAMNTTQAQLNADTAKLNTQQQNAMVISQLDNQNKTSLANIQSQYQNTLGSSKAASDLFNATMTQINNIQQNSAMNAATKQANVDQSLQMLKASIGMQGDIFGLDLASTLDFSGVPQ